MKFGKTYVDVSRKSACIYTRERLISIKRPGALIYSAIKCFPISVNYAMTMVMLFIGGYAKWLGFIMKAP